MEENNEIKSETIKMEFFGSEPKLRTLNEKVPDDYKLVKFLPKEISCNVGVINKIFNYFYSFNSDLDIEFLKNKVHLDERYFSKEILSKTFYYLYGINLVNCLYKYLDDTPDVVFNLGFDGLNETIDRVSLVKSISAIFRLRGYKAYTVIPEEEEVQRYFVVINSTDSLASLDKKLLESIAYVKNVIVNSNEDTSKVPFQVDFDCIGIYNLITDDALLHLYQLILCNTPRGIVICSALQSVFETISDKEEKEDELDLLEQATESVEYMLIALLCEFVSLDCVVDNRKDDSEVLDGILKNYTVEEMFNKIKNTGCEFSNSERYVQLTSVYNYIMENTNDLSGVPGNWKDDFVVLLADAVIKGCKYLHTSFCSEYCINNSLTSLNNVTDSDLKRVDNYIKFLISVNKVNTSSTNDEELSNSRKIIKEGVFE